MEWGVNMGENERNSINVAPEEYRKFFASYWFLHSALYNLAQGRDNQKKRRFTWAITNYYYSLVFVGRLYSFLVLNKYYRGHSDLAKLYTRDPEFRGGKYYEFNRTEFIEGRGILNVENIIETLSEFNITENYLRKFGKKLMALKNFRNSNTYEPFIIYGQEEHSILTDFLFTATDTVRADAEQFVKDGCMVFYNYWYKRNSLFVKLTNHRWLLKTTFKSLRKQRLDVEYIRAIINRGFYYENTYLLRQFNEEYTQIHSLQQETIVPRRIYREFESYCSIDRFKGKQNLIEEVHEEFRILLESLRT